MSTWGKMNQLLPPGGESIHRRKSWCSLPHSMNSHSIRDITSNYHVSLYKVWGRSECLAGTIGDWKSLCEPAWTWNFPHRLRFWMLRPSACQGVLWNLQEMGPGWWLQVSGSWRLYPPCYSPHSLCSLPHEPAFSSPTPTGPASLHVFQTKLSSLSCFS